MKVEPVVKAALVLEIVQFGVTGLFPLALLVFASDSPVASVDREASAATVKPFA